MVATEDDRSSRRTTGSAAVRLRGMVIALLSLGFIATSGWWLFATAPTASLPGRTTPFIAVETLAQLVDHRGETLGTAALSGRPIIAFFGYTYCPDVCPMELATITDALDRLGSQAAAVSPFFITLDPEHDSSAVLAAYLEAFHPSLIGLTGSPEAIAHAADAFGVRYARYDFDDGDYTIDHIARIFVLDRQGRLVEGLSFDGTSDELLAALTPILVPGSLSQAR